MPGIEACTECRRGAVALMLLGAVALVSPALAQTRASPPAPSQAAAAQASAPLRLSPEQVKSVQLLLNAQGDSAGPVDGVLGTKTGAALARFQRQHGLDPTGEPNPATLAALGLLVREASSPAASAAPSGPAVPSGQQQPKAPSQAQPAQNAPQALPAQASGSSERDRSAAAQGVGSEKQYAAALSEQQPAQKDGTGAAGQAQASGEQRSRPLDRPTAALTCPERGDGERGAEEPASGGQARFGGQPSLAQACALLERNGFKNVRAMYRDPNGGWVGLALKQQAVEVWVGPKGTIGARPLLGRLSEAGR